MSKRKNKSLGRGLEHLLGDDLYSEPSVEGVSSIREIPLCDISVNKEQPRIHFDESTLMELANSIKAVGLIQPITVCSTSENSSTPYLIVSGERRYRAAKLAGLLTVPAYIKEASSEELMEMALIENIQREDLNPIEVALAFKRLLDEYKLTQEALSERVGKSRASISNYIRLLRLPSQVQLALRDERISMGHAKLLLAVEDPEAVQTIAQHCIDKQLSVRELDKLIKEKQNKTQKKKEENHSLMDTALLAEQFQRFFDTKVSFSISKNGKGKISIPFSSEAQLEKILQRLDEFTIKSSQTSR